MGIGLDFEDLKKGREKICVVGLGYVGLPLAVLLSKEFKVVGYDVNERRIEELKSGIDKSGEIELTEFSGDLEFTSEEEKIKECRLIIVAVPTPVDKLKDPDLQFLRKASSLVGRNMVPGSVVVYESTVWPGLTEEVCVCLSLRRKAALSGKPISTWDIRRKG